jgi:hypothetical protein
MKKGGNVGIDSPFYKGGVFFVFVDNSIKFLFINIIYGGLINEDL